MNQRPATLPSCPGRFERLTSTIRACWLPAVSAAGVIAAILLVVARDYPFVGHDLRYYVPRLLDTALFLEANGPFAVQWYTPSFGGGLPAFPNPQHLQHSALQVLTAVVNPWVAYLLLTAAVSAAGFAAFARLLERRLDVDRLSATLGAVFYIGNGFFIEHLIVGHVGFQLFPLGAVLLDALTTPHGTLPRRAGVVALTVSAMLYQAGVYLIILVALSLLLVLPLLIIVGARDVSIRRAALVLAAAAPMTAAICAAKVYAVLAFMRHFPREIHDVLSAPLLQALVGFVLQLTGVMALAPVLFVMGVDPVRIGNALSRLTGATVQTGIWELDTSLSPVLWAILLAACIVALRRVSLDGLPRLEPRTVMACVALAALTWIMVEATLARGFIYPLVKPLPILRSLHVNHRVASVFILPLTIVAALAVSRWYRRTGHRGIVIGMLCLAVASPLAYLVFPRDTHQRWFDMTVSNEVYKRIRDGDRFVVTQILDAEDADALAQRGSSYRPYEPLFGYGLEAFRPETRPGDVREVRAGAFNLTHPAGYVFPEENGVRPFARIPVEDEANLYAFISRAETSWAIPRAQRWLNRLTAVALPIVCAMVVFPGRRAPAQDRPSRRG